MVFSIKDTIHVVLMKHELCSLLFLWYAVSLLCLSVTSWGLGCATRWQPECWALVSIHDLAVVDWNRMHTWFLDVYWCVGVRYVNEYLYCIIFERKGSQRTVLSWVGTAMDWVKRTNPSNPCCWLRVWKTRTIFTTIEITWKNYPRQSNLCSPTAVWLRTMSLTVPATVGVATLLTHAFSWQLLGWKVVKCVTWGTVSRDLKRL